MGFIEAIAGFLSNLLAFFSKRQEAQHDQEEREVGEEIKTVGDQAGAIKAEQEMGQALANSPKDKQDFDNQLEQGKF